MATTLTSPVAPPQSSRASAPPWGLLVAAACVLLAHLPFLAAHAHDLWVRPHYQFFPFVLVGAVVLAWSRLREVGPLQPGPALRSYGLVAVAWILCAAALLLNSSTMRDL
jgi:hypothetical protein